MLFCFHCATCSCAFSVPVNNEVRLLPCCPLFTVWCARSRVSYSQDRHLFHIVVHNGVTYTCMADEVRGIPAPCTVSSAWERVRRLLQLTAGGQSRAWGGAYPLRSWRTSSSALSLPMAPAQPRPWPTSTTRSSATRCRCTMLHNISSLFAACLQAGASLVAASLASAATPAAASLAVCI